MTYPQLRAFIVGLCAVAMVLAAGLAKAEHEKPQGVTNLVLCDTKEQILSILIAHANGGLKAGQTQFLELQSTPNEQGDATCAGFWFPKVVGMVVAEYEGSFEDLPMLNGKVQTFNVYRVFYNEGYVTGGYIFNIIELEIGMHGEKAEGNIEGNHAYIHPI